MGVRTFLPKNVGQWPFAASIVVLTYQAFHYSLPFCGVFAMLVVWGVTVGVHFIPGQPLLRLPTGFRTTLLALFVYVAIVTLGSVQEIYSLKLWKDFVLISGDAPRTGLHWWAAIAAVSVYLPFLPTTSGGSTYPNEQRLRGPGLISFGEAQRRVQTLQKPGVPTVFWGGLEIPETEFFQSHNCIFGETGSGKTKVLQLTLQSIFPTLTHGSNRRALIYDAKQDIYSVIAGMENVTCPVKILNPLDKRGIAWDIAKDVTDSAAAIAIAQVLIPDEGGSQGQFFPNIARTIIAALMESLSSTAPKSGRDGKPNPRWTLRDIILTLRYQRRMEKVLRHCKDTRHLVEKMGSERTAADIASTLQITMTLLSPIAAAWDKCSDEKRISLEAWLKEESILILGTHPAYEETLQTINRIIINRLFQLLLAPQPKAETPPHTWVFFDEFPSTGPLPLVDRVLREGRSKGIHVTLGVQDISAAYDSHSELPAKSILSACKNQVYLRTGDQHTQEYCSKQIGSSEVEITHITQSHSSTPGQGPTSSWSTNKNRQEPRLVLPSQFESDLPTPSLRTGISGYYKTACVHAPYFLNFPGAYIERTLSKPSKDPDLDKQAPDDLRLREWDLDDLKRLGLEKYPELLIAEEPSQTSPPPLDFGALPSM